MKQTLFRGTLVAVLALGALPSAWAAEANLTASNGARITVAFDPAGGTGTPGSSAVDYYAKNIRVSVTIAGSVPSFGTAKLLAMTTEGELVDQIITLQGVSSSAGGATYTGTAVYGLMTKDLDSGHEHRYQQKLEVDLVYPGYTLTLVNPEGDPARFQIDLAAAAGL